MEMNPTCHRVDYYGVVRPHVGYRHAGDAVVVIEDDCKLLAAIVDVLGHGPEAHDVATKAQRFLEQGLRSGDPLELFMGLHETLKGTRGAAAALGVLDLATGLMRYLGVGNTAIRRFGAGTERLVATDGIVGGHMRKPREQRMTLSPRDTVILYSDGVHDRFELRDHPQLLLQTAETIARTVVKLFSKDYDDAGCIVLRYDP
jgi:phosphoserine phosphatase RsbX